MRHAAPVLGVICHFVIALGAATVCYVVIPLSAAGPSHMSFALKSAEFVEHWFCVGLPIALSVRRFGGLTLT
jgi:hypothetical protein